MVKIGVTSWIWVYPFDPKVIPRVEELGFDGIEIPPEDPKKFDVKKTKDVLSTVKIKCSSICAVVGEDRDLTSPDKAVRENALKYLKFCCDVAAELGTDIVVGCAYAPVGKVYFEDKEAAWKLSVEGFREYAKYAKDRGLYVAVEPINRYETSMINLVSQALKYIEDVGMDNVGINYDTYHANIEEKSFRESIKLAGKYLLHIHSCENDRGAPGSGHIPWQEISEALKYIGYNRWLVIESFQPGIEEIARAASIWRPLEENAELIAIKGLRFLRSIFK